MSDLTFTPEELAKLIAQAVADGVALAFNSSPEKPTPRQVRNRRYYENNRRLKTSEIVLPVLKASESDASESVLKPSEHVLNGLKPSEIKTDGELFPSPPPALSPNPPLPPAPTPALRVRARKAPAKPLPDEVWLLSLEADPTYAGIDIRNQLGRMQRWCQENGGQTPSRRRFINWLNKADRTITTTSKPNANATTDKRKYLHPSGATGLANLPGRYDKIGPSFRPGAENPQPAHPVPDLHPGSSGHPG